MEVAKVQAENIIPNKMGKGNNIILNKMGKFFIANMLLTQATFLLAGIHW